MRHPRLCAGTSSSTTPLTMPGNYYIGINIGTDSVRAGLVQDDSTLPASSTEAAVTYRNPYNHRIFEQSTNNIWDGMCKTIRAVLAEANVAPADVKGLGFDATCSLAVSDMNGDPVVVTKGDQLGEIGDRNIILWADHRAEEEANLINSTGSLVLDYVGSVMSVRMCAACPLRWSLISFPAYNSSRWRSRRRYGSRSTWPPSALPAASSSTCPTSSRTRPPGTTNARAAL